MELAQLAVFVRPPNSGTVKTRLATRFGDVGAARLYRAFAEDTIALCSRVRAAGRVHLALWSDGSDETVSDWAERLETSPRIQPEGDLGVRLAAAFEEGLRATNASSSSVATCPRCRSSSSAPPLIPSSRARSCSAQPMTEATTRSGLPGASVRASKGCAGLRKTLLQIPSKRTPHDSPRCSRHGTTSTSPKTWTCFARIFRSMPVRLLQRRAAWRSSLAFKDKASTAARFRPEAFERANGRRAPRPSVAARRSSGSERDLRGFARAPRRSIRD